ncbi:hypothetical protein GCM10022407_07400 [Hymenobacter antarcticus]|uniref:Uncharacterized protein n=1 Tax=Hymenobacter antarcticus TaxID=486270 RepID=A0ABP7PC66_9BACT
MIMMASVSEVGVSLQIALVEELTCQVLALENKPLLMAVYVHWAWADSTDRAHIATLIIRGVKYFFMMDEHIMRLVIG